MQTFLHPTMNLPVSHLLSLVALAALAFTGCAKLDDDTAGQSGLCEVHHVRMTKRPLHFLHGMIPMSKVEAEQGEWKRRTDFYPHPGDGIHSTNIVLPGQEGRALAYVCPECRRAQRQMEKTSPR